MFWYGFVFLFDVFKIIWFYIYDCIVYVMVIIGLILEMYLKLRNWFVCLNDKIENILIIKVKLWWRINKIYMIVVLKY